VLKGLLPKKTEFFALFSRHAELSVAAACQLQTMMAAHLVEATRATKATVDSLASRPSSEHVRELCRAVKQVEKQNDRLLRGARRGSSRTSS